MKKKTKHTLLKGEGIHQHTLYGDFKVNEKVDTFTPLVVTKDSDLIHEKPDGSTGEHKTLKVEQGNWMMGQQVEFNPFDQQVTRVWD